jgi:hypothetical protein
MKWEAHETATTDENISVLPPCGKFLRNAVNRLPGDAESCPRRTGFSTVRRENVNRILTKAYCLISLRCCERLQFYGLWGSTDWNTGTKILKDFDVSIFRVFLWLSWWEVQQAPPKGWYLYSNRDVTFVGLRAVNHRVECRQTLYTALPNTMLLSYLLYFLP